MEAYEQVRTAQEREPEHWATLFAAAIAESARGNDDQARDLARCAAELAPDDFDVAELEIRFALDARRLEEGPRLVSSALARWPARANLHRLHSVELAGRFRFKEAEAAARRAAELDPRSLGAMLQLGDVLIAEHSVPEGFDMYRRAERFDPADPEPPMRIVRYHEAKGELEAALAYAQDALAARPGDGHLAFELGSMYRRHGRFAEAENLLILAVAQTPWSAYSPWELSGAFEGQGKLAEAEASLRQALERAPGLARVRASLARLLEKRGQLPAAEQVMRDGAPDGRGLMGAGLLARWLADHDRVHEAAAVLRPVFERYPDVLELVHGMEALVAARGQPAEALKLAQRGFALAPWSEVAVLHVADRLDAAERGAEADRLVEEARGACPNNPELERLLADRQKLKGKR